MKLRCAVGVLLMASVVWAQAKSKPLAEELRGPARESFQQGKDLFENGDIATAHAKFAQAFSLSKNPRLLWNMAACSARQKRYAQAIGEAERYLAEGRGTIPAEQVEKAKSALTDWRAFVATATIEVSVSGASVLVDKEPVTLQGRSRTLPLDVGPHEVQATMSGYEPFRETVIVKNVGPMSIPVELKRTPAAAPVAPAAASEQAPIRSTSTLTVLGWTSLGLGVASLAGGGFLHLQALNTADQFRAQCIDFVCEPGAQSTYADHASQSELATALYVGGGSLAVLGGVLLWAGASGKEAPARALNVGIGPRAITVGGAF